MEICVIKLSALGDCCLFLPAFNAIRRAYPSAKITWVISPLEHSLLSGLEGAEFVIYDKKSGLNGALALGKSLKNRRFDYLLMPQESLRASILSLFIRAGGKIGYDRARSKDFQRLFCDRTIAPHERAHLAENGLDFAAAIGAEDLSIEWNLHIPSEARSLAAGLLSAAGLNTQLNAGLKTSRYFILSPIANAVRFNWRNWSAENYAAAIDYASEKHGIAAVVTGGKSEIERDMAGRIAALSKAGFIDLIGKTEIKTLLALIEKAEFVLAPDSGPGHFAAALGTPAIALLACADPRRAAPYQTPSYCVDRYKDALIKYAGKQIGEVKFGTRVRDTRAMGEITPDDAAAMIDRVMRDRETKDKRWE